MRYESIPRKITNGLSSIYKYLKDEFGNWAYLIIAVLLYFIYKLVSPFLGTVADIITYIALGLVGLGVLYWLFKKLFR